MVRARAKTADDENFPVASLLLAPRMRPTVLAYYAVARAADDVADDPVLEPGEKLRRLDRFDAALGGRLDASDVASAVRARSVLLAAGIPVARAAQLLVAFRRDAAAPRCRDWQDLMAYCADSANPVGRFLLELHGEPSSAQPASDALCTALQVLNHLQDCGDDYRTLGRVYLPEAWLEAEAAETGDLAAAVASPGLRRVIDRCLVRVDDLLAAARPLPLQLRSTRLAMQAAVTVALAGALRDRLKCGDPLGGPIRPGRSTIVWRGFAAALACLLQRSLGRRRTDRRQPA